MLLQHVFFEERFRHPRRAWEEDEDNDVRGQQVTVLGGSMIWRSPLWSSVARVWNSLHDFVESEMFYYRLNVSRFSVQQIQTIQLQMCTERYMYNYNPPPPIGSLWNGHYLDGLNFPIFPYLTNRFYGNTVMIVHKSFIFIFINLIGILIIFSIQ